MTNCIEHTFDRRDENCEHQVRCLHCHQLAIPKPRVTRTSQKDVYGELVSLAKFMNELTSKIRTGVTHRVVEVVGGWVIEYTRLGTKGVVIERGTL